MVLWETLGYMAIYPFVFVQVVLEHHSDGSKFERTTKVKDHKVVSKPALSAAICSLFLSEVEHNKTEKKT